MSYRVTALEDEDGRIPPPDQNPPVGRDLSERSDSGLSEVPAGTPLRKVVNSKPFPPKEDEECPTEEDDAGR